MKKENPYEQNITKECDICSKSMFVDQFGNGQCEHCKWNNCERAKEIPYVVWYPNYVPFSTAKKLTKENSVIKPSIEDFMGMFKAFGEIEFTLNNQRYGVFGVKCPNTGERIIELFVMNGDTIHTFKNAEEFIEKAEINGQLLKEVWHKVENADWIGD